MKPTMKFDEKNNTLFIKLKKGKMHKVSPYDSWDHGDIAIYVNCDDKGEILEVEILL